MAKIVIVHGIGNQYLGEFELHKEWYAALRDGLLRAGHRSLPAPEDCYCAFYGDLFRSTDGLSVESGVEEEILESVSGHDAELVEAVWRAAREFDPRVPGPEAFDDTLSGAPRIVERALIALAKSKYLADKLAPVLFVGDLRQVTAYLDNRDMRESILERVLPHIQEDTKLIIGHSLGSVVAYEALCTKPDRPIDFLTLGSPLGIPNVVLDKLTPRPAAGRGRWPGNVRYWTNIAARGDIVAAQKALAPLFDPRLEDVLIDSGWDAHSSSRYLNEGSAGRAVAQALVV